MIPKIIAHRGYSCAAPENTIAAIQAALDLKVDFIEFDVRLTKDNVPIIFHDTTIIRTTNKKNLSRIGSLAFSEISSLDAGGWFHPKYKGEKIPSLKDVLNLNWGTTGMMIEIKQSPKPDDLVVKKILETINTNQVSHKIVIGSFSLPLVLELKKQSKNSLELIGIIEQEHMVKSFVNEDIKHLAIWHKLMTPSLMSWLHEQKIKVWAFTIDDMARIHSLSPFKYDGIISNKPHLLMV